MKKYLLLIILVSLIKPVVSQVYLINQYNGQTISSCAGTLCDDGDMTGNYLPNKTYTVTLKSSSTTNTHMSLSFNTFDIDVTDTLYIYDGPTTSSPLLLKMNNSNAPVLYLPFTASPYNSTGELTVKFISSAAANGAGWDATINCTKLCQTVIASIDSLMTQYHDSNYIDICLGDTVTFMAKGIYPQNGAVYQQDDNTSTFLWDFGDGTTGTGRVVDHFYSILRGYDIQLTITDVMGCISMNAVGSRVRMSKDPVGHIKSLPDICSHSSLDIDVGYSMTSSVTLSIPYFHQSSSLSYDSATFIPDGGAVSNKCYNTYVTFNCFNPGQTIQNPSDIVSVRFNMEHSFIGDLEMKLVCPNGQEATMKEYIQSGGAYLGVPLGGANHANFDCSTTPACIIDPLQNPAGTGWNYSFTYNGPTYNTMQTYASGNQIDSGSYTPFSSFSSLVGCPLNGTWNFEVCDYWAIDNGWVFSWGLELDASLMPVDWGYSVPLDTVIWTGPFISNYDGNSMTITPDTGGIFTYYMSIIDDFGCSYDTSTTITVVTKPVFDLGNDTTLCDGGQVTLSPPTFQNGTYYWLPNGESTQNLTVTQTGQYIAVIQTGNGNIECDGRDTININISQLPLISFAPDDLEGCQPLKVNFTNASSSTTSSCSYIWDFGDGDSSTTKDPVHIYQNAGVYNVTLYATTSDSCIDSYTVNNLITVYEQPKAEISANPLITTVSNAKITFNNSSTGNTNNIWVFGDGDTATELNPVHTFESKGTYGVWLYVNSGPGGCKDSTMIKIEIIDDVLEIPNIITPNNDGINDYFVVKNLEGYLSNELYIYDRWGKKVYYKYNYANDWDSENNPDGIYYFVLRCRGILQDQEITGSITVIGK